MKRFLLTVAMAVATTSAVPALSADVGVSITIGQPGFYGQIDVGDIARPPVVYARPVIIRRAPRGVVYEPLYLRVPPGHAKNWRKHCVKYDACGRPVYFVKDDWYNDVYVPHYRERHHENRRKDRSDAHHDHHDDRNGHDDHDRSDHGGGRDKGGKDRHKDH